MDQKWPEIPIEEVRRYLQGKMSKEEGVQFEQRMDNDPLFAEEVQLNRELLESMNYHFNSKLKQRLKGEDTKTVAFTERSTKRNTNRIWMMAASLALIAVAGYLLFFSGPDSQQLFDQYHTTYYNVLEGSTRSGETANATEAFRQYDQEDFQAAAQSFTTLISEDSKNMDWLFYQGLSNLEIQESQAAIGAFEKVLEASTEDWVEPAQWYLGLAHLQAGNTKEAKETFSQIVSGGASYSDRAKELMGEL